MRATSVTCPRAIARRRVSRTSPSHRDSSEGSFRLGLKKRWLTVRSSTLTRAAPTSPAAAPNPVMLRIMASRASYGAATTLSIPELPSHTVQGRLARQAVAGYELGRPLPDRIALSPEEYGINEADLDEGAQLMAAERDERSGRPREGDAVPVVVAHGDQGAELAARKLLQPARSHVDLRANLHLRPVERLPLPTKREDIGVNGSPNASSDAAEPRSGAPLVVPHERRIEDDRWRDVDRVERDGASREPQISESERHLTPGTHHIIGVDVTRRATERRHGGKTQE